MRKARQFVRMIYASPCAMLLLSVSGFGQSDSLAHEAKNQAAHSNHERAYELVLEAHSELRSAYSQERQRVMAELESKYEAKEKQAQIHSLAKELEVANLELARSQKTRSGLSSLAAISLLALCALFFIARSRKRALVKLRKEDEALATQRDRLQVALDELATLQGFLAICSYCKRLRDTEETWSVPESFFSDRADVTFSKQVCTECSTEQVSTLELSSQSGHENNA